jgi:uncharacterized membrane protein
MEKTLKTEILSVFMLVLSFAASVYFYMHFPANVPIHWSYTGEVDGWGSAGFAAFFMPVLNVILYLLLTFIPMVDPKKENIAEFGEVYGLFKTAVIFVMTAIFFMVGYSGLGYHVPVGVYVPLLVGLLFLLIGYVLKRAKQNWTIGIRTPWTLSSEAVWNKTHRMASKYFIIAGIIIALEGLMPVWLRIPAFVAALVLVIVPVVYSYFLFKKEQKDKPASPQL